MKDNRLIKRLLGEAGQDARFDVNARVEIWIDQDDLEMDRRIRQLSATSSTLEEKIRDAKLIAIDIAHEKIRNAESCGRIEITAEIGVDSINVDRIDWTALFKSPVEDES